jgi:hypothetical protein
MVAHSDLAKFKAVVASRSLTIGPSLSTLIASPLGGLQVEEEGQRVV